MFTFGGYLKSTLFFFFLLYKSVTAFPLRDLPSLILNSLPLAYWAHRIPCKINYRPKSTVCPQFFWDNPNLNYSIPLSARVSQVLGL